MPDLKHLTRDGVRLGYTQSGTGEPALLFVHGWCCDHSFFAPQHEHFPSRHRVVSVDLRGHGGSDAPVQAYTMAGFADDLAWLCGEIGVERAVVVGHSMGGLVTLALAESRPDLVRAAVLVDMPVLLTPEERAMRVSIGEALAGPGGGGSAGLRRQHVPAHG
jgi:pimeloyl-ACP methyl ester carboxylesterase